MELSFNVNAGPLTQISVPIISLTSAFQLAVGTYGWWRARERTKSLQGIFESAGASLVPANSFNLPVYLDARKNCAVRGISIMNGEIIGGDLPRSSTSRQGNPGQLCLRALTTSLLCFYSRFAVVKILAELIPYSMLHYEQEGETLQFEGPIFASLNEYVHAVEIEEDSTILKKQILQRLDTATLSLGLESHRVSTDEGVRGSDHAKVRALLKWILTSMTNKIDTLVYPTRSLLAWSLGMVISQLGFQISASRTIISSQAQYSQILGQNRSDYTSEVVLVVDTGLLTDPMEADVRSWDPNPVHQFIKPRIVPICAIPWIAFRETVHLLSFDIQHLADVWKYTFDTVSGAIIPKQPSGQYGADDRFKIGNENDHKVISPIHKSMLDIWSNHLATLLQKPMSRFVILTPDSDWQTEILRNHVLGQPIGEVMGILPTEIQDLWHILNAIILACLYAILAKVLVEDGRPATAQTEVCYHPHTVQRSAIRNWAENIPTLLFTHYGQLSRIDDWRRCVFGMVNGAWAEDGDLSPELQQKNSEYLGLQRNGILLVCGGLVTPSLERYNFSIIHHINVGQILTLPLKSNGYIQSAEKVSAYSDMDEHYPEAIQDVTKTLSQAFSSRKIRLDAEPEWENNPTNTHFAVREGGQQIHSLAPKRLERLLENIWTVHCTCNKFTREVVTLDADHTRWYRTDLRELLSFGEKRVKLPTDRNWFCDVGTETSSQTLALYMLMSENVAYAYRAVDCLQCAYDKCCSDRKEDVSPFTSPRLKILLKMFD